MTFAFPYAREWFSDFSGLAGTLALPQIRRPIRSGFRRALGKICAEDGVDLVHLHFSFALPFSLALSPQRWPLPVVYHWHNPPKPLMVDDSRDRKFPFAAVPFPAKGLASMSARFSDARAITHHVAVSREIRDLLVANRWTIPAKVSIVPNAISSLPDADLSHEGRGGRIVIGCVANFRPQKDHVTLIRAFERVARECPECRLVLVGDGPCRRAVMGLCESLGLSDAVDFAGYVSEPRSAHRGFDIAVLSSHYEGQSLVVLEAMAAGLPVVATRVGGIPETISDGVEGLLVPRGDAWAMAEALLTLVRDPQRRAAMGAAARRRVARDFATDTWAESILQLYDSVLDGTSGLPA